MRFLNVLRCAVKGHVPFNMGSDGPTFIQTKDVGNEKRSMSICARCDAFYATHGELTEEELAQEAEHEKQQADFMKNLENKKAELIKRLQDAGMAPKPLKADELN